MRVKRPMNRIISLLLVCVFLLGNLPALASAADTYTVTFYHKGKTVGTAEVEIGKTLGECFSFEELSASVDSASDGKKLVWVHQPFAGESKVVSSDTVVEGDMNIISKYAELFTVIFFDRENTPITCEIVDGETLGTNIPADPTRDGYKFMGWVHQVSNTESASVTGETVVEGDMNIIATWAELFTVGFYDRANDPVATYEIANGEQLGANVPNAPVRDGYKFTGWQDFDTSTAVDSNTIVSGDMKIVSTYSEYFTIEFYNLGTVIKTIERTTNEAIGELPDDPARDGYEFVGWQDFSSSVSVGIDTIVNGDMKIVSTYAKLFAVTLNDRGTSTTVYIANGNKIGDQLTDVSAEGRHWVNYTTGDLVTVETVITGDVTFVTYAHTWDDATCDTPNTCSVCGETEGDALGHDLIDDAAVPATCTANGKEAGKHCSCCDYTEGGDVIPATGHKDDGSDYKCDVCGENLCTNHEEEEIPAVDATCTATGLTAGSKCSKCGEILTAQTEVPALGHNWEDATCTVAKKCSVCQVTEGKALGHTEEVIPAVAPTCTATGLTEGKKCSVCGHVIVAQTVIDALGHTWTNADCDTPKTCSVCGATEGDALGHTEVIDDAVVATCTTTGLTQGSHCSVCGHVIVAQTVIDALSHTWTDADCDTPKTCSVCGATEGDALGHTYVSGTCTVCGAADPDYVQPGDPSTPSTPSTYTISTPTAANGAVTVDDASASKGETITITVTPDEGYELDTLTVADASGNKLTVTALGDGKYTFTMPAGKVTVNATFKAVGDEPCDGGVDCPAHGFLDVDTTQWYHKAVDYAITNGLMSGTGANIFEPLTTTSRGMIVTILYRLEGKPSTAGLDNPFTDLTQDWYIDAVKWSAANGIVGGYGDGKYGPEDAITREQLAAILCRYAQYKGYNVTADESIDGFADVEKVSSWAYEALTWAYSNKIMQGVGNNILLPGGASKRCEAAAMLMRFIEGVSA